MTVERLPEIIKRTGGAPTLRSAARGGLFRHAPFLLAALLIAGLVHLLSILMLPRLAPDTTVRRLVAGATANQMDVLQSTPETLASLPFADPFLQMATCRFDVEREPVRLRVGTGDQFMSLLVLTDRSRVTLALTDRAATRRQLDIVLATAAQIRQLEAQDPDDEPVQELRVRVPETRGLVVLRALAPLPSDVAPAVALLSRATCRPQPL